MNAKFKNVQNFTKIFQMVNDVTVEGQSEHTLNEIVVNILISSMGLSSSLSQEMIEYTEFVDVYSLLNEAVLITLSGTIFKFLGYFFCN